jgi:hypothetical protein
VFIVTIVMVSIGGRSRSEARRYLAIPNCRHLCYGMGPKKVPPHGSMGPAN